MPFCLVPLKSLALFVALISIFGCAALRESRPVGVEGAPLKTLRARAVASIAIADGKTLSGKAVVLAERPARFRIEFFGPLGVSTALVIGGNDGLYVFADGREQRLGYGEKKPFYPLEARAVVSLLFGENFEGLSGDYEVSTDNGRVKSIVHRGWGKDNGLANGLAVRFDDFRPVGEADLPFDIEIETRAGAVFINYTSMEINPELDETLFTLPEAVP
jgi:hypothetical protein